MNILLSIFFKSLHIFLGYDFGFFKYSSCKLKCVAKFLCVFQSLLFFGIWEVELFCIRNTLSIYAYCWFTVTGFQYVVYVIIFVLLGSDLSFYNFDCVIRRVDAEIDSVMSNYVEKRIILAIFICFLYRLTIFIFYFSPNTFLISLIYALVIFSTECVSVVNSFVFYSIYTRLMIFTSKLKMANDNFGAFHILYKSIVDVTEKIKDAYDLVFFIAVLVYVPQIMTSIYYANWIVQYLKLPVWRLALRFENVTALVTFLITLAPAVAGGALSSQANEIKMVLHAKTLLEKDESKRRQIEAFIRYVEARPLKLAVYKLIPLDANLVVMVFKFSVNYLIVIMQFTNLY